jgi:RNA polymerase sigma-70 factor (ECF subfamily)
MEKVMQDAEAICRLKHGEIDGLETLVERYQVRAVRTAYLVLQDEALAEDVAQETFLHIFERIRFFDETRPFKPYLMRSVVNAALDTIQKLKHETDSDGESNEIERLMSRAASVEAQTEADELQEQILAAIAKLPPRQRAVIVQRYYLEMSEAEMAQTLDAPAGTIKWLLNAARARPQTLLGAERSAK